MIFFIVQDISQVDVIDDWDNHGTEESNVRNRWCREGQSSYEGLIPKSNIESAIKAHFCDLGSLGLWTLSLDVEENSGKMTK